MDRRWLGTGCTTRPAGECELAQCEDIEPRSYLARREQFHIFPSGNGEQGRRSRNKELDVNAVDPRGWSVWAGVIRSALVPPRPSRWHRDEPRPASYARTWHLIGFCTAQKWDLWAGTVDNDRSKSHGAGAAVWKSGLSLSERSTGTSHRTQDS